jgi:hypothetical protein
MPSDCGNPGCEICGPALPFELPSHLVDELTKGRLVIFAGAGVSTEGHKVFPCSFYDKICETIGDQDSTLSFPDLMSRFCEKHGRAALLTLIKERLDYGYRFPEVFRMSTRFHRAIATIPLLQEIVTTNWDDLFEQVCHALPFVTSEDLGLWNVNGRKVIVYRLVCKCSHERGAACVAA